MLGYKITFEGLPETLFACSTSVDNYEWKNNNQKNTIEIAVSTVENLFCTIEGTSFSIGNTHLSCLVGDEERRAYAEPGKEIKITSVAVTFQKINSDLCTLLKEDAYDNSVFLLPCITNDFSGTDEILRMLKKYIKCYASENAYDKAMSVSIFFNIIALIDKNTRQKLSNHPTKAENYYTHKLEYIIDTRFSEKLLLSDIAKEFGVSMSYLSSVFTKCTGQSFRSRLLEKRILKAYELLQENPLSTEEIAIKVGFCDVVSFRKSFKKFFGVSITGLKNIENSMTLYHSKPLRF